MSDDRPPWESKWTLIEPLDSAGAGKTALVEHVHTGERGVIKLLYGGRNRYTRASMAREIVNLTELFNAGCVVPRVLDKNTNAYEAKDGALYFVREFVEGRTVFDWISQDGPWETARVNNLVESLARSLRLAFGQRRIHGDLRPDNIVVNPSDPERFVILNYGITFDRSARPILQPQKGAVRQRFLDLPEFLLHDAGPDEITDITGLVGLAYYALTADIPGTLVGPGGHAPHQRDPERLAVCFEDSKQLIAAQALFEQGFARHPGDRFQTLDDFLVCWHRVVPPPPMSADALGLKP